VSGAKATCPCCNITLPPERVRAQLAAQCGGADAEHRQVVLVAVARLPRTYSLSLDRSNRRTAIGHNHASTALALARICPVVFG
jgi:hypothetical protein